MKYRCFHCNEEIPQGDVKRCSRCRITTYCSKECQRAAWKSRHKEHCVPHSGLQVAPDGKLGSPAKGSSGDDVLQMGRRLNKWLVHWRDVLLDFSFWAHDLANHPDSAGKHFVLMEVTPKQSSATNDKLRDFVVTRGILLPASAAKAFGPTMPNIIHRNENDAEVFALVLTFNNPGGPQLDARVMESGIPRETMPWWTSMDKATSAFCAAVWEKNLIHAIMTKTPQQAFETFRGGDVV
ncbi:hypothetical protein PHLGIDRAFT_21229 [Phlebiopsis gigantea 11061_1 CR5-6]|uniref:MYND-type domain-containing protein n=1 Tax=Phlebiopsis gigantea (strain 11061_1 CR5-6) TaxID=745531 RepID=A0A0C3S719_PHLG1|nr:hypothetical protein PHLGIDRAFT_21229 [Phlebiopsis gigantea 11061_1 CR5-6]